MFSHHVTNRRCLRHGPVNRSASGPSRTCLGKRRRCGAGGGVHSWIEWSLRHVSNCPSPGSDNPQGLLPVFLASILRLVPKGVILRPWGHREHRTAGERLIVSLAWTTHVRLAAALDRARSQPPANPRRARPTPVRLRPSCSRNRLVPRMPCPLATATHEWFRLRVFSDGLVERVEWYPGREPVLCVKHRVWCRLVPFSD